VLLTGTVAANTVVTAGSTIASVSVPTGGGLIILAASANDDISVGSVTIYSFCSVFDGGSTASSITQISQNGYSGNGYYSNAYLDITATSTSTTLNLKTTASLTTANSITYRAIVATGINL
jgi:hypothetical protein